MPKNSQPDPRLFTLLDELNAVPLRNPQAATRARAGFLSQAVSIHEKRRHSAWIVFPTKRKEQFAMNVLISALVMVGLLFGGSAAVAAAQDDLPNEPLYAIKLLKEDVQLWLNTDPATEVDLLMEQVQTRTEEMAALAAQGVAPEAALSLHIQERIQQALKIASSMDDAKMTAALQQIRTQLQTQEQLMIRLNDGTCVDCEPVLQQTQEMLQAQMGFVEDGLTDPQVFRNQNQIQNQIQPPLSTDDETIEPAGNPGFLQGTCDTCTPVMDGSGQQNGSSGHGNGSGNQSGKP